MVSFFTSRLLCSATAALALICAAHVTPAHADVVVSSTPTESVASKDQLSAQQLFAKVWQVKGSPNLKNGRLDEIDLTIPGRIFVSYDASLASGLVAQVKVSGSSKAAVEAITMFPQPHYKSSIREKISEALTLDVVKGTRVENGTYLLTEIRVKNKRALRGLTSRAGVTVIEDNVLLSLSKEAYDAVSAPAKPTSRRRLADTTGGLVVKELDKNSTNWSLMTSRMWTIQPSDGVIDDASTITLDVQIPGNVSIYRLSDRVCDSCIAQIRVSENNSVPLAQVTSSGAAGLEIALKSPPAAGLVFWTSVEVYPGVNVKTTAGKGVNVQDDLVYSTLDAIDVFATRDAKVFVNDKADDTYAMFATFTTYKNASLQINLPGALNALGRTSFAASDASAINWFGKSIKSRARAMAEEKGTICIDATEITKMNVTTKDTIKQVSYPGSKTFACTKRGTPKRIPGNVNETLSMDDETVSGVSDGKSGSDKKSGATHVAGSLSQLIAAALVLASVALAAL